MYEGEKLLFMEGCADTQYKWRRILVNLCRVKKITEFTFGNKAFSCVLFCSPSSQSSVMFVLTQVLTGGRQVSEPFLSPPAERDSVISQSSQRSAPLITNRAAVLRSSGSGSLLLGQLSMWALNWCFGSRWRALKGQIFSSLASLGWFYGGQDTFRMSQ